MAKRPTVPKFGNWGEDDVPYTIYFDKARKGKKGDKMINPNDPQEYPEMFANNRNPPPPAPRAKPYAELDEPVHRRAVRPTPDPRVSHENYEYPAHNDNPGRRNSAGSAHQRGGQGAVVGRSTKHSVGSDNSFDRSPMHPHYQAKVTGRGSGSPAWEGKNSYDSSHGTPGRSRMKPRGDDTPDRGAAVPRFGEWDENNPSSGDNYTHIFNKVREERVTSSPMSTGPEAKPNYSTPRNQKTNNKKQSCCFPW